MNVIEVADLDRPELQVYSGVSEPQLYHYYEPEPGLFIAESPMIIQRALDAGYEPESVLIEEKCLTSLQVRLPDDIPVYAAPLQILTKITGYALTRGILCAMRRKPVPDASELLKNCRRAVILEDVMNPSNAGAIFRSAAALGMDSVFLTRGCTDPLYRRAARVSMGTVFQIPWTYLQDWPADIEVFHRLGFTVAAMALTDQSVSLERYRPGPCEKTVLIMGTEGEGLKENTLKACDLVLRIPMSHGVDSLNVAAAAAVAFWQVNCGNGSSEDK